MSRPKIVCIVPAKGTSERIAGKNVAVLDGEYLFRRKIEQALACPLIDAVYLDTEDDKLAALADDLPVRRLGRPADLATNATDGHALFAWECAQVPDADICIQALCTAPFVDADTLTRAIEALLASDNDSLVAVHRASQYRWQDGEPTYGRGRIPNSVELPPSIVEAMSLYIVRRGEGSIERRFGERPILFDLDAAEQLEVNVPADFALAEQVAAGRRAQENGRLRAMRCFLSSPVLADIAKEMGLAAVLPPALRPTSPGKVLGRAKTLAIAALNGDRSGNAWKGIYGALDSYRFVRDGDVIMVANEAPERAYFGDLNATLAIRAGAQGVVVDGVTRDTTDVRALGLPVYARGAYCDDIKYEGTLASIGKPIEIGGVAIRNGDYVFADDDGVVIIPAAHWPAVAGEAWKVMENEARIRMMAARGRAVGDILSDCGAF